MMFHDADIIVHQVFHDKEHFPNQYNQYLLQMKLYNHKILLDNIGTADEVDDFRYITEG